MNHLQTFGAFVGACVTDPRAAMRKARGLNLTHGDLWMVIALAAILRVFGEVLVGGPQIMLTFADRDVNVAPVTFAIILAFGTTLSIFVLHHTARVLGGTGTLGAMLLAFAIIDVVSLVLFVAQLLVLFVLPQLLWVVQVAAGALMVVILLNLISVAEGFHNLFKALATVILGILGVSFGAALFLVLIGGATAFQT